MQPSDARLKLQENLKNVNWINLLRVMESLAAGEAWGRYDNNQWRPNYKQAELDLPWMLDNFGQVCEALRTLREEVKNAKAMDLPE